MAAIRCMFVGQMFTNLPEDRVVNTFHFFNLDPFTTHVQNVFDALTRFYTVPHPNTPAVGIYIAPVVMRSASLKAYNLADLPPRVPTEVPLTLPAPNETAGLPEECAAVMSFHGEPPVTARRRGRVYLGPLTTQAASFSSAGGFSGLTTTFRLTVNNAAQRLAGGLDGADADADWAIRSSVPAVNYVPIVGGWIDSVLDTQRRRGPRSDGRNEWVV